MALRLSLEECTLTTRHPFAIARGSTTGYRRAWVRVIDEEGLEGWGEADPSSYYGETYDTVRTTIERLAPHLPRDPFDLEGAEECFRRVAPNRTAAARAALSAALHDLRSEEHTSELQSPCNLVCRLLLEKKKNPSALLERVCRRTSCSMSQSALSAQQSLRSGPD